MNLAAARLSRRNPTTLRLTAVLFLRKHTPAETRVGADRTSRLATSCCGLLLSILASCLIDTAAAQGTPEHPRADAPASGSGGVPGSTVAVTGILNELESRTLKSPEMANQLVKEFLTTWLAPRTGQEGGSAEKLRPSELMEILDRLSKISGLNLGPMDAAPQIRRFVAERAFYPFDLVATTPNSTELIGIISRSSSQDRIRMMAAMLRAMCEFDKAVANQATVNPEASVGSGSKAARKGLTKSEESAKEALEAVLCIVRESSGLDLPVSKLADVLMPIYCTEPMEDLETIEFAFRYLAMGCNSSNYGYSSNGVALYRDKGAAVAAGRKVFDKDLIRLVGSDRAAVMSVRGRSGSHFIAVIGYDLAGRQFMVRDPSGELPNLVPYETLLKIWPKENTTKRIAKGTFDMTIVYLMGGGKPTALKPVPGIGEMKISAALTRLVSSGVDPSRINDKEVVDYMKLHGLDRPTWLHDDHRYPKDPASYEVRRALSALLQLRLALGSGYVFPSVLCMVVKSDRNKNRQLAVFKAFKGGFMHDDVWFLMNTKDGDSVVSIEDIVKMALVDGAKPPLHVGWCLSFGLMQPDSKRLSE